jgi:sulfur transfer complex TusBCD TusB component (DsrH family)
MQKEIFDFSDFDRTHNNAIDLVAQAVGWARKNNRAIESISLSPGYFDLFRLGLEVLARARGINLELEGHEILEMDGVKVTRGNRQWEKLIIQWYEKTAPVIILN